MHCMNDVVADTDEDGVDDGDVANWQYAMVTVTQYKNIIEKKLLIKLTARPTNNSIRIGWRRHIYGKW